METENIHDLIIGKVEDWLTTTIEMLPDLAVAILVLVLFYVLAKFIKKIVGNALAKVT